MDITIEGFHTWMWKGLSFLLPFLFGGYFFQAYNSYVLYKLSRHPDAPWQVAFLSLLFFILFVGNTFTTLVVVPQKLRGKIKESYRLKSVSWAMKIRQQIKVRCEISTALAQKFWHFFPHLPRDRAKRLKRFDWASRKTTDITRAKRPKINKLQLCFFLPRIRPTMLNLISPKIFFLQPSSVDWALRVISRQFYFFFSGKTKKKLPKSMFNAGAEKDDGLIWEW